MEKNGGKPQSETKKSRLGCAGIVIGVVLFFAALVCVLDVIMAPDEIKEATINREKVVEAIFKYKEVHGSFPASLKDLGEKKLDAGYWYYHDAKMFLIKYQGSGLVGDGVGEFYRSDKREWKTISGHRKEYFELQNSLVQ